ncbi:MAG TPA: TIGR02757 family protein [Flavobacteriales bacterium]|nr:TIGR02757 family protein [Flavobacteriales bacterium]MDB9701777.1 TIGR02757 family protein [Salibacteraceae bacterium]HAW20719.1 TIGR02757 family protein [Flavobacteriales bacterium]
MPLSNIKKETQEVLENAYQAFAKPNFIESDPIQIPARFTTKEDIEISGFIAATIAWGQRPTIIRNANRLIELMDGAPSDFIRNHESSDRERFSGFVHRTFNDIDAMYFLEALQHLYTVQNGLEGAFDSNGSVKERIAGFHHTFFGIPHLDRTKKHVSNPEKGSSAKRLNMFLRWMVRPNKEGIDFGIWKSISPSELMMPLDVHTGNVGRKLGLLKRKQNDWKAVEELTASLRLLDPIDPIRFDLALFAMGVNKMI